MNNKETIAVITLLIMSLVFFLLPLGPWTLYLGVFLGVFSAAFIIVEIPIDRAQRAKRKNK